MHKSVSKDNSKYAVVGSFALGKEVYGGQTLKVRNFTDQLEKEVQTVLRIDTAIWKSNPLRMMKQLLYAFASCNEIVMLPADRGIFLFARLLPLLRKKQQVIKYVVVGGWLPNLVDKHQTLEKKLRKFDGIYVETQEMANKMIHRGFDNIHILPNFKQLDIISPNEIVYTHNKPYHLITFSRVMREKGIEDAVNAVIKANNLLGSVHYTLDIYGKVDGNQKDWFEQLRNTFPEFIKYRGVVDGSKSTSIIHQYFALLFPTYYYGEGYPGTVLDAFSSGVPVIASDWAYNKEIVTKEKGFVFETKDVEELSSLLVQIANNPEMINRLRMNCLNYANEMRPEKVIRSFLNT